MKRNKVITTDERTKQVTGKAAVITLCVVWLGVLAYALYKAYRYGVGTITEELVILCGSLLVFLVAQFGKGDVDMPTSMTGRVLPVGKDFGSRFARFRSYLAEGALDAIIVSGVNVGLMKIKPTYTLTKFVTLADPTSTLIANFVIDLLALLVVFTFMSMASGEKNVKKYLKQLEEEERFDNKLK